jgi:hypothetical protein
MFHNLIKRTEPSKNTSRIRRELDARSALGNLFSLLQDHFKGINQSISFLRKQHLKEKQGTEQWTRTMLLQCISLAENKGSS